MADPLSGALILGKLIDATIGVVSGYAGEKTKNAANARIRLENQEFEREKLAIGQTYAHELEARRAAYQADQQRDVLAAERLRALEQHQRDHYPIAEGPGQLRKALTLSRRNNPQVLTVLLCPPDNEDPSSPTWSGLRQRVYDNLMTYQNRGLVILRKVDRPFHWVNHDLYTIDLYGIPTLIVQFSVDHKRLGIHLGGCHVSAETVHEMSRVHAMTFPSLDEWSKDTSALAGLAAEPPADEHDLLELNHDLATRLVTICVVVAVDTYYLQRRRAYVEQFDEAVAAAGIFGDDWPADLGVNSALVADPAFHLLHRAQRKVRRGLKDEAIEDVNRALRVLSGVKSEAERRALRLMREALGSASTEEHHKAKLREVFESFPEHDQLRLESLDLLSESLLTDQGQPEEPAAESPAEPVALPPAPVSPVPPPAPRPLLGRSGWTQRANRNPLDD